MTTVRCQACILFVVFFFLGLPGCSRSGRKVIGVVSKGQAHEYWQAIHAGAVSAGHDFGVDILWNGPSSEADVSRQIAIVESMINRGVDGIALAPVEKTALVSYVERAKAAHIPVTIYDSGIDTDDYLSYVATNNYQAGTKAARKLGELLGGKGQVLAVKHMPGSASSMEREKAFDDVLKNEFPNIHIVAEQFGMGDRDKVLAVVENLLIAHPEANAIFASAESSSAGAVLAVRAKQLTGKMVIVAFDSSPQLIDALRDGTISALVVQDPFRIGYEAVKTLAENLQGKKPPRRIDLDARVITKPDLDDPAVHAILFPDLKKFLDN